LSFGNPVGVLGGFFSLATSPEAVAGVAAAELPFVNAAAAAAAAAGLGFGPEGGPPHENAAAAAAAALGFAGVLACFDEAWWPWACAEADFSCRRLGLGPFEMERDRDWDRDWDCVAGA
jgi:hypothetical protein